jgi:tetratricopeptide (TPR) repeat protein
MVCTVRQHESKNDRVPALAPERIQRSLLRRWLGIWLLVAALVVILGGFAAQAWVQGNNPLSFARSPAPTVKSPAIAPSTATPAVTPTRTVPQRVAEWIPRLERAWEARDWPAAMEVLEEIALLDGNYAGLRTAQCDTYLHWAQDMVAQERVERAYSLYHQALAFCQDASAVQSAQSLAAGYLSGKRRYDHERWREAAIALQAVYDAAPEFADAGRLLYSAYIGWARTALAEGRLDQARDASQAALGLDPSSAQAAALLGEAEGRLTPTPTPAPTLPPLDTSGRLIEVNISEQRMYVWEGDTLLYQWVCSTGEPGRPTAPGRYRVLDKIPEAWASAWSLRMPYWLGIYYAGPVENGIHALPILPSGQTLWAGYLGSPVSYGCIVLSTENARTLYNWAQVGTPVWVHY